MQSSKIRPTGVYDYKPKGGNWPCVQVEMIEDGRVLFRWLEEEGGAESVSLKLFASRCTSERDPQTWNRIQ